MNYPAPKSATTRRDTTRYVCGCCGTEGAVAADFGECSASHCKHSEHKALCCDCSVTCDLCGDEFCREHVHVIERKNFDDYVCHACADRIKAVA